MINAPELAGEMIGSERPKAGPRRLFAFDSCETSVVPNKQQGLMDEDAEVAEFLIGAPT